MSNRSIIKSWRPQRERQSAIHEAAQVLPPGRYQEFDPFLLMAEDWFWHGTFLDHPHRGIETVTYVISGHMGHYDNKSGHEGVLGPGDVQWMTAGHGVIHKEDPVPGEEVHSLQLWVNLPRESKLMPPRYQDLSASRVPMREEDGYLIRVYSGRMAGLAAPTDNVVPIVMAEIHLEAGRSLEVDVAGDHNGFLYILEGEGAFGANAHRGRSGEVLWLSPESAGEPISHLTLHAIAPLRVLIYTGKPLHQPVVAYGPFVMTSIEEIQEAFDDYHGGRFI